MNRLLYWLCGAALALTTSLVAAVQLPVAEPVPGGIAVISLGSHTTVAPVVHYQGRRVMVLREGEQWHAVVGIPLDATPGRHTLRVHPPSGGLTTTFEVQAKAYEEQHLTVQNKRMVNPTAEDLKRIAQDQKVSQQAYRSFRPEESVPTRFSLPVAGRLSSTFGLKRFFNGEARNPHSGLDLAAAVGTPVSAPAAGHISATGNFFFNGNTVFIDHGQGLVSMYCHLDGIAVKAGQHVAAGEAIGTVGMSGRVTGPHLHWSVSLNDSRVDPMLFMTAETLAQLAR